MAAESVKSKSATRGVFYGAVAILLTFLAVLAFLYRDYLTGGGRGTVNGVQIVEKYAPYSYGYGAGQVFAPVGGALAIASGTGYQLLDGEGETVLRITAPISVPCVTACGTACAFYDADGTELTVTQKNGEHRQLAMEANLISASISRGGMLAVSCECPGYKGKVTVYDGNLTPVYEWYSAIGYIISACVSPNGSMLAVLCAAESGGSVRLYSLDSIDEQGRYDAKNELFLDMAWLSGDSLCAVSESGLSFIGTDGELKGSFDFEGMSLGEYSLGEGVGAVFLNQYISGGSGTLTLFSGTGELLGKTELEETPRSIAADSRHVLLLQSGCLTLYDNGLQKLWDYSCEREADAALLSSDGRAFLLCPYSAEVLDAG